VKVHVVITIPHYWDTAVIDPDFSVLLNLGSSSGGSEDNGCADGSSGGHGVKTAVVVGVVVPIASTYIHKLN
jgi:hypothetical protein